MLKAGNTKPTIGTKIAGKKEAAITISKFLIIFIIFVPIIVH